MNDQKPQANNLPADDDQIYDLLVDGELDNNSRRDLLGSLDDKPGGWRRCALAFLEAQSWGQEFHSLSERLSGKSDTSSAPKSQNVSSKKKSSRPSKYPQKKNRVNTILGLAASFLLAMGITSLMQNVNPDSGIMPSGTEFGEIFPSPTKYKPQLRSLGLEDNTAKALHLFHLSGKSLNKKKRTVGLPAITQSKLNEQWVKEMPTVIPDGVVEAFQQAGHDVKTTRHLIPFQMRDGRRLIVPVDQVDIRYDATPYFQ